MKKSTVAACLFHRKEKEKDGDVHLCRKRYSFMDFDQQKQQKREVVALARSQRLPHHLSMRFTHTYTQGAQRSSHEGVSGNWKRERKSENATTRKRGCPRTSSLSATRLIDVAIAACFFFVSPSAHRLCPLRSPSVALHRGVALALRCSAFEISHRFFSIWLQKKRTHFFFLSFPLPSCTLCLTFTFYSDISTVVVETHAPPF